MGIISAVQQNHSIIHIYIYTHFHILFHYGLSQNIEYPVLYSRTLLFIHLKIFFNNDFYFFQYSWFTVFCQFLLYSKVIQSHTHTHTHIYIYIYIYILYFTFSSIMLHHKWLDIVLSAVRQELIAYPLQMQLFASINPRFPVHPTPSPSPLATTSLFSKSMIFFSVERFICAVY